MGLAKRRCWKMLNGLIKPDPRPELPLRRDGLEPLIALGAGVFNPNVDPVKRKHSFTSIASVLEVLVKKRINAQD